MNEVYIAEDGPECILYDKPDVGNYHSVPVSDNVMKKISDSDSSEGYDIAINICREFRKLQITDTIGD